VTHVRSRPGQRRARVPPTFNIMVVGSQSTGKTSLLRLLLETADISPTATVDQRTAMEKFLRQTLKRTQSIQTACVEICESRYDRVLLSVVDTPGLDFHESRALKLDRQVSGIIKYLETQYGDTMSEEAKVIRQSKGDQHIHLCIYMIDPTSVMSASARRASTFSPAKTRSETTISYRPPDLSSDSVDDTSSESEDDDNDKLTMSPAELRVIRRLTVRANVLPVIARADSLTDERLTAVKHAVNRELHDAGLDFGVFGPPKFDQSPAQNGHSVHMAPAEPDADSARGGRQSRTIIKLRPNRHTDARRSRSRSRFEHAAGDDEPLSLDTDSIASVRFSAQIIAKMDLSDLLPFALIAPEQMPKRSLKDSRTSSYSENSTPDNDSSAISASEDDHDRSQFSDSPLSPTGNSSKPIVPYTQGPPSDLKGMFLRKFRWGTVDVLDPNHCDFAALRTAVLSTHMKMLKIRTKEVLYEKYRTEKLLARRATKNISEEETKKLLEEIGL